MEREREGASGGGEREGERKVVREGENEIVRKIGRGGGRQVRRSPQCV